MSKLTQQVESQRNLDSKFTKSQRRFLTSAGSTNINFGKVYQCIFKLNRFELPKQDFPKQKTKATQVTR